MNHARDMLNFNFLTAILFLLTTTYQACMASSGITTLLLQIHKSYLTLSSTAQLYFAFKLSARLNFFATFITKISSQSSISSTIYQVRWVSSPHCQVHANATAAEFLLMGWISLNWADGSSQPVDHYSAYVSLWSFFNIRAYQIV